MFVGVTGVGDSTVICDRIVKVEDLYFYFKFSPTGNILFSISV